jgi:hypothetical protein
MMIDSLFRILECVQILLSRGAPVKAKNLQGWSSLAEAISYGDRPTSMYTVMMRDSEFKLGFAEDYC